MKKPNGNKCSSLWVIIGEWWKDCFHYFMTSWHVIWKNQSKQIYICLYVHKTFTISPQQNCQENILCKQMKWWDAYCNILHNDTSSHRYTGLYFHWHCISQNHNPAFSLNSHWCVYLQCVCGSKIYVELQKKIIELQKYTFFLYFILSDRVMKLRRIGLRSSTWCSKMAWDGPKIMWNGPKLLEKSAEGQPGLGLSPTITCIQQLI